MNDVYTVDNAHRFRLLKKGARIRTDGSTNVTGPQFTGTIVGIGESEFSVSWDDKEGGSYDRWVIYLNNSRARIEFLTDEDENSNKEESKDMSENTRNVKVNDTIMEVLKDEKSSVANEVNKYFCEEIPNNLTGKILLEGNLARFKKEAASRAKEDKKKEEAKKG